ncbi:MAG: hypothetical protein ACYCUF_07490, partial [Acidimicrobiales bacterium]
MIGHDPTELLHAAAQRSLPAAVPAGDAKQVVRAVGTIGAVLPPAPGVSVSDWLGFLRKTGAIAAIRSVQPPRRTLLALPTNELGAAAVAVGAVTALASHRSAHPLDVLTGADAGCEVSAFYSGAYHDTVLLAANPGTVRVSDHTTMTTYADTVRRLPAGFPTDRPQRRLRSDCPIVAAWRIAPLGIDPARLHARCSATPVLVIGSHKRFTDDLAALNDVWPHSLYLLDPGTSLEAWLRHPVIVADPRTPVPAWLPGCDVASVVCDGAAAWRTPLRRA